MATEPLPASALPPDPGAWHGGWHARARHVPSPNFGPRPPDTDIDLAIVHSISLPPGVYGGDEVERLFTNTLDWDAHPFEDAQYEALASLLADLSATWPIRQTVGHEHVAPGRKQDPGNAFEWARLAALTGWQSELLPPLSMPRQGT